VSGDNTVDIHGEFDAGEITGGVDDVLGSVASLAEGFVMFGGPAAIAVSAVSAAVGALGAGLYECIQTAIELDEKWSNFDREDRMSTLTKDLKTSWDELKGTVGEEFVPALKDGLKVLIMMTDATGNMAAGLKMAVMMSGLLPGADYMRGLSTAIDVASNLSPDAARRRERRAEDDWVVGEQAAVKEAAKGAADRAREERKQDEEEKKLGAQNRRDLEKQEKEELREMERALSQKEKFDSNKRSGKGLGEQKDDFKAEFASSAEDVYRKIAAGAAQGPKDATAAAVEKMEAAVVAQQEQTNKLMSDNLDNGKKTIEAIQESGGLA
jgi:hypothetical protein